MNKLNSTAKKGKLNYTLGIDVGIASVGWAVLENGVNDEPRRIVDLNVRTFKEAENKKDGKSPAVPRRKGRHSRRICRRRKHRRDRIKWLFEREKIIKIDDFMKRYERKGLPNVYRLRYEALERKLTNDEFAQVMLHIAKHRGFKSTRTAKSKDKDEGKMITATKENKRLMEEKGYRTVGEMIYKDEAFTTEAPWSKEGRIFTPRNKEGDYRHTILRDLLEDEVKYIFECQRKLGNTIATKKLEESYLDIMLSQRSFDEGPGNQADGTPSPYGGNMIEKMVGSCTFEKDEKRAAKATYTSEKFILLQKINHTYMIDKYGVKTELTPEQKKDLIQYAHKRKELKYKDVRKRLNIPEDLYFKGLMYGEKSMEDTEKAKFASMDWTYDIQKRRGKKHEEITAESEQQLLDDIATILTKYKSDNSRRLELQKLDLEHDVIENLLELNPRKFQHLSLKAMKKIMPFLEQGDIYNVACDKAGYDFNLKNSDCERNEIITSEVLAETLENIKNPVVKRSVSQTIKVINAIIKKYGSPQSIHVELSRDMSKDFIERQIIKNKNEKNQKENEKVKEHIKKSGINNPTGMDIIKFRLFQEQGGICMYSGERISEKKLFQTDEYEVDHIIPYSISFDDRLVNKVLVKTVENRNKGDHIPSEYFETHVSKMGKWDEFESRVNANIGNYKKRRLLLKKEFTEEERKAYKSRNINDTRYIARVVMNMLQNNLKFAPYSDGRKKKRVYAVNGSVTSYLRRRWGLMQKDRTTDKHHAMDAVVIACCTDSMIQKITKSVKARERAFYRGENKVDIETGEIMNSQLYTREEWDEKNGADIPLPWSFFKLELEARMSDHPELYLYELQKNGYESDEEIKPFFISRMPNYKVTGQEHEDTIRNSKIFESDGISLAKTELTKLSLKNGEIENYYAPQDDRLLYEALKQRLIEYDGVAKKAFEKPFYKPKADGSQGPLVRKVKLKFKQSSGVLVNNGKGIASNGSMIRIDVFNEDGKYYFVPIYTYDARKNELPNRAATAGKTNISEWRIVSDKNFLFSLYPGDLIRIKRKKPISTKNTADGSSQERNDILIYYTGADKSTGNISGKAHDGSFTVRLGIQSLEVFEKYHQVDVLGNFSRVKSEKRRNIFKKK